MIFPAPIRLASRSPRRKLLLEEAGISVVVQPPQIDDGKLLAKNVSAEHWVAAMALLKALDVAYTLHSKEKTNAGTVLAADTVCVHRGKILGQPRDANHARTMLHSLKNEAHRTITGVCLIRLCDAQRILLVEETTVKIGNLTDSDIDHYIQSNDWQGKAGGYNLIERVESGWPILWDGDPTTVMGLPMDRLLPLLKRDSKGNCS